MDDSEVIIGVWELWDYSSHTEIEQGIPVLFFLQKQYDKQIYNHYRGVEYGKF